MIERFEGREGRRLLVEAMKKQQLVANDGPLARALVEHVSLSHLAPGEILIHEGAGDNDLYFVLAGRLAILCSGREIGARQAGEHVGEVALLDPTVPRSATVVAREPTVVAKIAERDFNAVARHAPSLWRALAASLGATIAERNRRLADHSVSRHPAAADATTRLHESGVTAFLQELCGDATDLSGWDLALQPGAVIGRFQLVREVGRGGFGVVWEARDLELGRAVAFKALTRRAGAPEVRAERLLHEAEAAARLSHPNIVTLYDMGHDEHGPYLVLELLRGETLAARLARARMPLGEALRIATQVASGLAHAHEHGVVHRDLKPGNVFLCEGGQAKLLDLGLALAFGRRKLGVRGGTPTFMAPEQRRGAPEDERTDVFALGVLVHYLVSGAHPFGAGDAGETPPAPLDAPDAPGLADLVRRMLEVDPTRRPRDAGEVLAELGEIAARAATRPGAVPGDAGAGRAQGRVGSRHW